MISKRASMNHANAIPEEWQVKLLGDVILDTVGGGTPSTNVKEYWQGDIHWTTSKRLSEKLYLRDGEKRISKKALAETSVKLVPEGNVIVSTRVTVGKAMVTTIDMAISQDLTGLLIDRKHHSPEFIAYQLKTRPIQVFFDSQKRGATIKGITREDLKKISVVCPPLPEQQAIANVLFLIQSAIENQEKAVRTTTELKRAFMQKLFTEGLHGEKQKQTEIGPIPRSWNLRPLKEVREFLQYGTSVKCGYHGKGHPVIRIPNVVDGKISLNDLKWCELSEREINSLMLKLGDILFIRTNGVRGRVGSCAVYLGQPNHALFASYLIRAQLKTNELMPEFFYYFSRTSAGVSQLAGRSSSASDGKFNINTKIIDAVLTPTPMSLDEQKEIVDILQTLDGKMALRGLEWVKMSGL